MILWNKPIIISWLLLSLFYLVFADTPAEMEQQCMESLGRCCSPEQRAWYEQQYELYIKNHPATPLKQYAQFTVNKSTSKTIYGENAVKSVLVLINKTLYSDHRAREKIDRYLDDINRGHGCKVNVEVLEGGTEVGLKNIIKQYYTSDEIDGVIQIGSLPAAWFFDADSQYGGNFTCDLFYEDLDGTWLDNNTNGKYDEHLKGSGNKCPEVFYARIDPGTMGSYGTEVDLLCTYLDKNHAYWSGGIPLKESALAYIEKDWANSTNNTEKIYGLDNTEVRRYGQSTVSRSDYTTNRLTKDYSFIHMWCHSGYNAHYFTDGGSLGHSTIMDIKPKPIGYAHDGCHCADWAAGGDRGYTAGAYVYSESPTSLVCISGTKTGQWIGLKGKLFFEELGKNSCIGQAYKIWFADYIAKEGDNNIPYFILWNYGYVILGDPMICFKEVPTAIKQDNVYTNNSNFNIKPVCNNRIQISYLVSQAGCVSLRLYNVAGRCVATLVHRAQNKGKYTVDFDSGKVAKGLYVLKLNVGGILFTEKVGAL